MISSRKFFYWTPRILSIGFVLFISLFALDVFSEYSGPSAILPLLIHLLPSFVLLLALIIAWRYELVGVLMYLGFALLYLIDVGFSRPLSWYLGIVLPSATVGIFYFISWLQKKRKAGSI